MARHFDYRPSPSEHIIKQTQINTTCHFLKVSSRINCILGKHSPVAWCQHMKIMTTICHIFHPTLQLLLLILFIHVHNSQSSHVRHSEIRKWFRFRFCASFIHFHRIYYIHHHCIRTWSIVIIIVKVSIILVRRCVKVYPYHLCEGTTGKVLLPTSTLIRLVQP